MEQSAQVEASVANLAIELIAYGDMQNEEMVGLLLTEADAHTLGLVIALWYEMACSSRGPANARKIGQKTGHFFQEVSEHPESEEVRARAARHARRLMLNLTKNQKDSYAKLWQNLIATDRATLPHVGALFLGFALGAFGPGAEEEVDGGAVVSGGDDRIVAE